MIGNDINLLIDIMIILTGVFLLKNILTMKKTGRLERGFMLGKNMDISNPKDPEGFIRYMYVKTIVLSVLVIFTGAFQIFADYTGEFHMIAGATSFALFGLLILYAVFARRAQNKYL
ncbi:MAG: hypothetical protein K5641_01685 [Lachnospiraceae bacterium]|nr:hypothetical protein [Lachnospiraceae bacterium]